MSDGWWILLGLAGAAWLFWPRRKQAPQTVTSNDTGRSALPSEPPNDEERHVQEARLADEQIRKDEQAAWDQHQRSLEDVRAKLSRARKCLSDSGVDRLVPEVWETVEHWASWVSMPDRWTPPEGVHGITGGGDDKDRWVAWIWSDRRYRLHFVEKQNYLPDDSDRLSQIDLEVDEEPVCSISCSQGPESYESWRYTDVEALTVGSWMPEFVRMAGQLRAEKEASSRKFFSDFDREKAARLNLGD
jgi:hypothetical protein